MLLVSHTQERARNAFVEHHKNSIQFEYRCFDRLLPKGLIRSHYGHGFAKQYVRDDRLLRTEPATNNVYDYGVKKDVENLPQLRARMSEIIDRYHASNWITLGNWPVMHALVRFANVAGGGKFTTAGLYVPALDALGR